MPESPDRSPTPSAVEASQRVRGVVGRLRRRLLAASDSGDISLGQQSVLARLAGNDGMTVSDLATAEGMRHQSMTTTVRGLLELGLVHRRPDPDDGRRLRIELTAPGRERVEEDRQARREWLADRLQDRCTEDERRTVITAMAVLERLIDD